MTARASAYILLVVVGGSGRDWSLSRRRSRTVEYEQDMGSRWRVLTMRAAEVEVLVERWGLVGDPFDPRIGPVVAAQAFWDWIGLEEADTLTAPTPLLRTDASAWAEAPEAVQRVSPVIDVGYGGHRIGILPVVRRENSLGEAPYILVQDAGAGVSLRLDALVCAYVELQACGDVAVLFDGYVTGEDLKEQPREEVQGGTAVLVEIPRSVLRPMSKLRLQLARGARPAGKPLALGTTAQTPHFRRGRRWLRRWAPISVTAVALAGVIVCLSLGVLVLPDGPHLGGTVVNWGLSAETVRGPAGVTPVLLSGQEYQITVRAATPLALGWVYQVDAAGAYLLGRLSAVGANVLERTYEGRLDDRVGTEYFVVVLADVDPPALAGDVGPAPWLTSGDLGRLQEAGRRQDDGAALEVLGQALKQSVFHNSPYEVQILRFEHRGGQSQT